MTDASLTNTDLPHNIIPFPMKPSRLGPRPLNPALVAILSEPNWSALGVACRVALAGFGLDEDDLVEAMGVMLEEAPDELADSIKSRGTARKILQRCQHLLRDADKRETIALDQALAARGH